MSRRVAGFLISLAAFMLLQWTMLIFNLQGGHPTAFYVVHGTLIAVNLILGLILATIGIRGWRRSGT